MSEEELAGLQVNARLGSIGPGYVMNAPGASAPPSAVSQMALAERQKAEEARQQAYEEREREREVQSRDDQIRQAALHGALVTVGGGGADPAFVVAAARKLEAFLRGEADTPKSH